MMNSCPNLSEEVLKWVIRTYRFLKVHFFL